MAKRAVLLDKISGYLFTAGFFISRARILPFVVLNTVLNVISLLAYLAGYAIWFVATLFYPNHPRRRDSWFGFAEFREQYQLSSVLGFVATFTCLIYPPLTYPRPLAFFCQQFFVGNS